MRTNGRAPLYASQMRPNHLSYVPDEKAHAVCPDCGQWAFLVKASILADHRPDGAAKCPGSRQKIKRDIGYEEWLLRWEQATPVRRWVSDTCQELRPRLDGVDPYRRTPAERRRVPKHATDGGYARI